MADTLPLEQVLSDARFCRLDTITGLQVQLRYASANNFVGRNLYGQTDCAWLRVEAASGLAKAIDFLRLHAPGISLLVLDALRPQRIQEQLWQELANSPLQRYLANPELGSMHSFGMAVDATLVDSHGRELDMGSQFDQMDETSHPEFEARLLASGQINSIHIANRQLLRGAMLAGGFAGIRTEWWHFDCGDKAAIRSSFPRVV
jgi:zinc D-Ala-D-Ala dipeptidase